MIRLPDNWAPARRREFIESVAYGSKLPIDLVVGKEEVTAVFDGVPFQWPREDWDEFVNQVKFLYA